jgi:hypothetical protein
MELETLDISREGYLKIRFNQKMLVPSFLTSKKSRRLISVSDISVNRDILDLTFMLKSNVEPDDIKYFLKLEEWTEDYLNVYINFTDPL